MPHQSTINPNAVQKAQRHIGRIPRLRSALEKPGISNEKRASLQAELDRRLAEVQQLRESLESI